MANLQSGAFSVAFQHLPVSHRRLGEVSVEHLLQAGLVRLLVTCLPPAESALAASSSFGGAIGSEDARAV